jgi:hypothetical protein
MATKPRIVVSVLVAAGSLAVLLAAAPTGAHPAKRLQGEVVSQTPEDAARAAPEDSKKPGGPMDVFADIERGWNSRNVDLVLRHFGAQKVAISVDGTGPSGGTFSRSQSYYLLKDLFRYTTTKKFEFVQYRKPGDEGGRDTFAIAERHYRKTDDGRLFTDKVYVSLHLEHADDRDRWVVDQIKSIR